MYTTAWLREQINKLRGVAATLRRRAGLPLISKSVRQKLLLDAARADLRAAQYARLLQARQMQQQDKVVPGLLRPPGLSRAYADKDPTGAPVPTIAPTPDPMAASMPSGLPEAMPTEETPFYMQPLFIGGVAVVGGFLLWQHSKKKSGQRDRSAAAAA